MNTNPKTFGDAEWKELAKHLPSEASDTIISSICANIIWSYAPNTSVEDLALFLTGIYDNIQDRHATMKGSSNG